MKIPNETKVGALAAVSIALLIIGFNLLKGNHLFSKETTLYAVYHDVNGLQSANPIKINGLKVGSVSSLDVMDKNVGAILVTLNLQSGLNIPKNSMASIVSSDLLGSKAVVIDFGNAGVFLQNGDTIRSAPASSLTSNLMDDIKPLSSKVQNTLTSLDTVLTDIHASLDNNTQKNLRSSIAALNVTMQNFSKTSAQLDQLVRNLNSFTQNLNNNSDTINQILSNTQQVTASLSQADITGTVNELHQTLGKLDEVVNKVNNGQGSLGMLINDEKLYHNLRSVTYNLNLLMEDLRLNPKRYVHFSLFGRKGNTQPLPGDTLK